MNSVETKKSRKSSSSKKKKNKLPSIKKFNELLLKIRNQNLNNDFLPLINNQNYDQNGKIENNNSENYFE
jgi:hypothetical protein